MKKVLTIITVGLLITCLFSGCSSGSKMPKHEHSYEEKISTTATCTEGGTATYKCTQCEATEEREEFALGHPTNSGACWECGDLVNDGWGNNYDNMGAITEKPFIHEYLYTTEILEGSYGTNYTKGTGKLYAGIEVCCGLYYSTDQTRIHLYDGNYNVIRWSDYSDYSGLTVKVVEENGVEYQYPNVTRDDYLIISYKFVEQLLRNKTVDVYIQDTSEDGVGFNCSFTVYRSNFPELWEPYYAKYFQE